MGDNKFPGLEVCAAPEGRLDHAIEAETERLLLALWSQSEPHTLFLEVASVVCWRRLHLGSG